MLVVFNMEMEQKEFIAAVLPVKDKMYRFAKSILKNNADAEDTIQDVLVKLWQKRNELKEVRNLDAWCLRIVKNSCLDRLKSSQSKVEGLPDHYESVSSYPNPLQQTESQDSFSAMIDVVDELPQIQRMIFSLRELEGYAYNEIAEILNISLDKVKVSLFRARQTIRGHLIKMEAYES